MNGEFMFGISQATAVCLVKDERLLIFRFCFLAVPLKECIWTYFQQVRVIGENHSITAK